MIRRKSNTRATLEFRIARLEHMLNTKKRRKNEGYVNNPDYMADNGKPSFFIAMCAAYDVDPGNTAPGDLLDTMKDAGLVDRKTYDYLTGDLDGEDHFFDPVKIDYDMKSEYSDNYWGSEDDYPVGVYVHNNKATLYFNDDFDIANFAELS